MIALPAAPVRRERGARHRDRLGRVRGSNRAVLALCLHAPFDLSSTRGEYERRMSGISPATHVSLLRHANSIVYILPCEGKDLHFWNQKKPVKNQGVTKLTRGRAKWRLGNEEQ